MLAALCAFIGSVPFEMSLTAAPGAFSITTLIGYGFFVIAIFNMRRCFAAPPLAFWAFVVYLYITLMTSVAFSGGHRDEAIKRAVTLAQLVLMLLICVNLFRYKKFFFAALWAQGISCFFVACLHTIGFGATAIARAGVETRETTFGADPNFQSMIMGTGALALIGLAHGRRSAAWWLPFLVWPMAVLELVDMSRTGSRAGLLGFGVGLASFVIMKTSPAKMLMRAFALFIALIGSVAVMLQSPLLRARLDKTINSSDTNGRELIFNGAVAMFKHKPLFGYGMITNQYELFQNIALSFRGPALYSLDTHNQLLGVATETGLVGLIPFLIAVALCFRDAFRSRVTSYGVISLSILIATVVANSSGNGHILKSTWIAFAFAMGTSWAYKAEKNQVPAEPTHPAYA